jgi:2-keto-4-pentenoate hydratase
MLENLMSTLELAHRLWAARLSGGIVDPASVTLPGTIEEAYAIQSEIVRISGHRVCGFKVGSTSVGAQRLLGTNEPGSGALLVPFVHDAPATIALSDAHMPALEGEFAFRLARPLPPRAEDYDREEVASAIGAIAGAIEVVGTRFAGGLPGKGRLLTTADGGVNVAMVLGPWSSDWRHWDLPGHAVSMTVNDEMKGQGTGARALGDPMNVLTWLANQQSRFGRGLDAGAIVTTGTCTGLDPVRVGDRATADFGQLGTVAIMFTAMTDE